MLADLVSYPSIHPSSNTHLRSGRSATWQEIASRLDMFCLLKIKHTCKAENQNYLVISYVSVRAIYNKEKMHITSFSLSHTYSAHQAHCAVGLFWVQ